MAIIQYSLNSSGKTPDYIADGGYFLSAADGTFIGIGSGGGTEITQAALITRALDLHAVYPMSAWVNPDDDPHDDIEVLDNDGVTDLINAWCAERL